MSSTYIKSHQVLEIAANPVLSKREHKRPCSQMGAFSGKLDTFLNLVKEATPRAGFWGGG